MTMIMVKGDQDRKTRNTSSTGRRHIGHASAAPAHAAQRQTCLVRVVGVGARGVDRADCVSDDCLRDAPHDDQ